LFETLTGVEQRLFDLLALGLVLFYAYSAVLEPAPTQFHRGVYVLITYSLVFLTYRTPERLGRVLDYLLILASIVCIGYWIANFEVINYRAGPAKVSVIASGLFGSISGSAIANTVSTGAFTILMMNRAGFRPHVAGGIEPAASLGGMFMPPIMGAGGFITAELTGIPYAQIMLVAVFPALMYFFSVFVMVHYEARRFGIRGEKSGQNATEILRKEWLHITPLVVITLFILNGYSPGYSAVLWLATCILVSHRRMETRIDPSLSYLVLCVLAIGWLATGLGRALGPAAAAAFTAALGAPAHWISAALSPLFGAGEATGLQAALAENLPLIYGLLLAAVLIYRRHFQGADIKSEMHRFVIASRQGTLSSLKIGATVGVIGIIIGVLTYQ